MLTARQNRLIVEKTYQRLAAIARQTPNGVAIKRDGFGNYCVRFAKWPPKNISSELINNGYQYKKLFGIWIGSKDSLPDCVRALIRKES
jgi:hypothetical protein